MKKHFIVLFVFSVFAGNFLRAQADSTATKVEFMYVSIGFNFSATGYTDAENMLKMAKDRSGALLNENLASYFNGTSSYYRNTSVNGSPDLSAGVGIRLWNKQKGVFRKSTLRFGMRYTEFNPLSAYYSVDSTTYAGTYYNTNTNFQPIVVNEVKHSSYTMNYHLSIIQAEVAQYFHTKEMRRVSVYGGYILGLGASVFSRLEVSKGYFTEYTQEQTAGQSGSGLFYHKYIDSDYAYDRYKAKGAVTAGAGLVMGAQLRFSKKNNAFGRLTYALEMRPGINTFLVGNSGDPLTSYFACTSLIKYRL
jgi:hypothetical protein